MLIIRPARTSDIEQLMAMSIDVGVGMTSMPADRATWDNRIGDSERCFAMPELAGESEATYFMVMEETESNQLVGTTAVYSGIGSQHPFFSYKVSKLVQNSEQLGISVQMQVLFLVNDYTGSSELGSLYLVPPMRRNGNGRFISRCRYLLLADFPERFGSTVIAELRGWQDDNRSSPFWRHLGKKFFGIAFQKADYHSAVKGTQFIADLMPKYPIYVDLLPAQAQEVIGKAHADSLPALKLLEREGFKYEGYVDVFDGGPTVSCEREQIGTVAASRQAELVGADACQQEETYLVSNSRLNDYRMLRSPMRLDGEDRVWLPAEAIEQLRLDAGATLRYVRS